MIGHIVLALGYSALSLGVVLLLPALAPGLDRGWLFSAGVSGFLLSALLHEVYRRGLGERRRQAEIARLRQAFLHVEEELRWARREMRGLLEALETGVGHTPGAGEEQRAIGEVMAEVRLLKSLVEQLSGADAAQAAEAADAANVADAASVAAGRPAARLDGELNETRVLQIVREALRDDHIDVVLQPIVSLPQRKRRFYECYTRLTAADGSVLRPDSYIEVAERAGLITAIDNMLLFRCIQLVRKLQRKGEAAHFFCNIAESTLGDLDFFGDFVDYLETNPELAPSLVFEFSQAQLEAHGTEVRTLLLRLRRLGARFSLDQVRDLALDLDLLAAREIGYVKIEAAALGRMVEERGAAALSALIARFTEAKIDLIVEKIEAEDVLRDLLDYGIDFGQGFLFGEPRLARLAA